MILVIDNYDSFVHNLARYFQQLGCEVVVMRNDEVDIEWVNTNKPQAIVISPGPCTPDQAGCSLEFVKTFGASIPILGVCLGHQAIVQALGGTIRLAHEPVHGRQSEIRHFGSPLFNDVNPTFTAGRYHSLVATIVDLPKELSVTAQTDDGTIMSVEHRSLPIVGVQFHPESILTGCGYQILINFLKIAGIDFHDSGLGESALGDWRKNNPVDNELQRSTRLSTRSAPSNATTERPIAKTEAP